jgi:hypothetical protein
VNSFLSATLFLALLGFVKEMLALVRVEARALARTFGPAAASTTDPDKKTICPTWLTETTVTQSVTPTMRVVVKC